MRRRTGEVRFKVYDASFYAALAKARTALGDNDFEAA